MTDAPRINGELGPDPEVIISTVDELARHFPEFAGKTKGKAGTAAPPPLQVFTEAEIAALDLPPPKFVVHGLFPVGVVLLAASPKIGKTWLAGALGRAVAAGVPFGGRYGVEQGPVLQLDLEGGLARSKLRQRIIRGDAAPSPDLHTVYDMPPMDSGGLDQLRGLVKKLGARVVIVDIWARFRPARPKGADAYQHDYAAAKQLQALAHELQILIVLVHHTRKANGFAGDWTEEISGSNGTAAAVDCIAVLKRERGAMDAILHVTGRDLTEDVELAMQFQGGRWSILGDADEHRMNETRRAIFDCLSASPVPLKPSEVAKELAEDGRKITRDLAKKTMRRMLEFGSITADTSGRYTTKKG